MSRDDELRKLMSAYGLQNVKQALAESRRAKVNLSLACAVLTQESHGANIYGHDPVKSPQQRGGHVTQANYARYKQLRKQGYGMQGVGPMQLTWYAFQDEADKLGGCWKPTYNMRVGFTHLKQQINKSGKRAGIARYNGTGPAAQRYADSVLNLEKLWHSRFRKAGLT